MTLPGWALLVALALGVGALALRRLPRERAMAVLLLGAAAGLLVLRQVVLALPLAALALKLWRGGARGTPAPGGRSQVGSARLTMTLDHATGTLDGTVTAGSFAGVRLSELSAEALQQLYGELEAAGDVDSLALLQAWLDRSGRTRAEPPPATGAGPMTVSEAYRVLGLAPGASVEEVRAAYRRLMRRVHPDLGGSGGLAALLNEARRVLDPG